MSLLKKKVGLMQALRAPIIDPCGRMVADPNWPLCRLCGGRELDAVEIVEAPSGATYVRVLGKHHGAEQLTTFDIETAHHDEKDLASAMRAFPWFEPDIAPNAVNDDT